MTFIERPAAPFKVDFLRINYTGTMVNNPVLELSGTLDNTSATLLNDRITIYSGSHWRIEFSNGIIANGDNPNVSDLYHASIYDETNSTILGQKGILSGGVPSGTSTGYLTRGSARASALVLDGDISTSLTLRVQIEGGASNLNARTASNETRYQYGIVKIMELPA